MATTTETAVTQDATKAVSAVKTDIASVEATVKADLAKTYSGKIVALAFVAGGIVTLILRAIL